MPRLISRYPDGAIGVALLLMRISYAWIAFPALARLWPTSSSWWLAATVSTVIALAVVTGFGTRMAALLLLSALVADLLTARGEVILFILGSVGGAGALALLGPGAYSIDAHRYGRQVIRLEPRSPDRGSPG
ncbi:hypothetical protein IAG41_10830 [Sphingomonas sp. JC676]|uniref:hypothetical protein n=1 Tax=Sphingomonas sp. JC676 TaxID=2768065 RepID=UPI00165870A9|nr:hypothetical protein [Sphingomonas sp. JC676]MBC9032887.1 hypothetical protein [Sphingomonas sp. JC676]